MKPSPIALAIAQLLSEEACGAPNDLIETLANKSENAIARWLDKHLKTAKVKPRLIVVIEGGVVQGACSNLDVSFEVYDKDDEQETDPEASPEDAARFKRLSDECDNLPAVY